MPNPWGLGLPIIAATSAALAKFAPRRGSIGTPTLERPKRGSVRIEFAPDAFGRAEARADLRVLAPDGVELASPHDFTTAVVVLPNDAVTAPAAYKAEAAPAGMLDVTEVDAHTVDAIAAKAGESPTQGVLHDESALDDVHDRAHNDAARVAGEDHQLLVERSDELAGVARPESQLAAIAVREPWWRSILRYRRIDRSAPVAAQPVVEDLEPTLEDVATPHVAAGEDASLDPAPLAIVNAALPSVEPQQLEDALAAADADEPAAALAAHAEPAGAAQDAIGARAAAVVEPVVADDDDVAEFEVATMQPEPLAQAMATEVIERAEWVEPVASSEATHPHDQGEIAPVTPTVESPCADLAEKGPAASLADERSHVMVAADDRGYAPPVAEASAPASRRWWEFWKRLGRVDGPTLLDQLVKDRDRELDPTDDAVHDEELTEGPLWTPPRVAEALEVAPTLVKPGDYVAPDAPLASEEEVAAFQRERQRIEEEQKAFERARDEARASWLKLLAAPATLDVDARVALVERVGRAGEEMYVPALRAAYLAEDEAIRKAVLVAIGTGRYTEGRDVVLLGTQERAVAVRAAAYGALGRLGAGEDAIRGLLDESMAVATVAATAIAAELGTSAARERIRGICVAERAEALELLLG